MESAKFLENGQISGSTEPRNVVFEEIRASISLLNPGNVEIPRPVEQTEQHQQQNNHHPTDLPNQDGPPQKIPRRSRRARRSAISYDYVVYIQEHDIGIRMDDSQTYSLTIKCPDSSKW